MTEVLLHVQHLLGIGHLKRAALLAKALDEAGLSVVLVSGGLPVPDLETGGAELVQLAALKTADAAFSGLVDEQGQPIDESWKAARREALLSVFRERRPRLLLIELFPFGRRQLRFELLPLLQAAWASDPRPAVVCSLRDILNPIAKPEKKDWILKTARRFFDRVLVHGDPEILPLEASFPEAAGLSDLIAYTGYVAARQQVPPSQGESGEVLVSTGGGAVAAPVIRCALAARSQSRLADRPWRILAGHGLAEDTFRDLARQAPPGVTLERNRADFPDLLRRCLLSVSQGGYNTMMDILGTDRPAVILPFATEGEREQTLRAEHLAQRGLIALSDPEDPDGTALAGAIDRAMESQATEKRTALKLNGAAESARLLKDLLSEWPA